MVKETTGIVILMTTDGARDLKWKQIECIKINYLVKLFQIKITLKS